MAGRALPASEPSGEVHVLSPDGSVYALPPDQVKEAIRLGGTTNPVAINEALYGGVRGQQKAALLGAAETASLGLSTAIAEEFAGDFGDSGSRRQVANDISRLERTNPLSHIAGEVAPLMLVPEGGGEIAASKGASLLARGAEFAAPKFARGVAEMAHLEGSQGLSEELLDQDLAAESYWAHAFKPEVLFGGVLNVGLAAGFKGLGKVGGKALSSIGGKAGEVAATDAKLFEEAVFAGQKAGLTSDETGLALRRVQELSSARANAPAAERGVVDAIAEKEIAYASKGNPDVVRQLRLRYKHGSAVEIELGKTLDSHAVTASKHVEEWMAGVRHAEDVQFTMKHSNVRALVDDGPIIRQLDAARQLSREMRSTLFDPVLPPQPKPLEAFEKQVMREWKAQGIKLPAAPEERGPFMQRARQFAEAARASEMATWEEEVARIVADREKNIDPRVRELWGDLPSRVGMQTKVRKGLERLLGDFDKATARAADLARAGQSREAAALIRTAFDDFKRIEGNIGKYDAIAGVTDLGAMGRIPEGRRGVGYEFARWFTENKLRPLLEDSSLWGEKLAAMQRDTNSAWSTSKAAVQRAEALFVDGATGKVDPKKVRAFLESTGDELEGVMTADLQAVEDAVSGTHARTIAMRRTMNLTHGDHAALDAANRGATEFKKLVEEAKATARDLKGVRELKAREARHGLNGIVGKLLDFAVAPSKALEMLSGFKRAENEVRSWLGKESKSFLSGERAAPVKGITTEAERRVATQTIEDVKRYRNDPRSLAVTLRDAMGPMVEASPQMASALATVAARSVLALVSELPEPLPPRFTDHDNAPRYAPSDLDRFWRKKQLVENPKLVMNLMRSGQIHEEDIELAKKSIPILFEKMRMQLVQDVLRAKQMGGLRTLSYQEQLSLSRVTGLKLDASQDDDFTRVMQESAMNDPMNQAAFGKSAMGGGRPSKLENINLERVKTLTEKLEE